MVNITDVDGNIVGIRDSTNERRFILMKPKDNIIKVAIRQAESNSNMWFTWMEDGVSRMLPIKDVIHHGKKKVIIMFIL